MLVDIIAGVNSLFSLTPIIDALFPSLVTTPLTSGVVDSGRDVNETVKFGQQVCDSSTFMH